MNRRGFFALSAYAAAHAAFSPRLRAELLPGETSFCGEAQAAHFQAPPSAESLSRLVGTRFKIRTAAESWSELVLQDVVRYKPQVLSSAQSSEIMLRTRAACGKVRRIVSYRAAFRVEGEPFEQGSYIIRSKTADSFSAFLVPHPGSLCHASFSYFDETHAAAAQ